MKTIHLISEMSLLRSILGSLIFIQGIFTSSDDVYPPSIVQNLKQLEDFIEGSNITLFCKAAGSPNLTYAWKKDGEFINEKISNVKLADGYLNITSANHSNEGYYQCLAKNDYGTACTDVLNLRDITLKVNKTLPRVNYTECKQDEPCLIMFDKSSVLTSFSEPEYSWEKGELPVNPSKRIQIGDDGTLYFAHSVQNDSSGVVKFFYYSSWISNAQWPTQRTARYFLKVKSANTDETKEEFAPKPTDICKPLVTGLVGSSAKMRCFFYGNPEPDITWTNPRGEKVKNTSNFDTELEIKDVSFADEGKYTCTAENKQGKQNYTIEFRVEAAPKFANDSDHPYDATVQAGDNLTFHCIPEAKPEASVTWYMDGTELHVSNLPPRFEFSEDGKSLTILDVCLNCMDTERDIGSDMMVIQCNASNKHGYAFRNGYVKVVDRQPTSTSTSTSRPTSPSSSPRPVSACNKTELTNWLILFIVGLKSLLPVH